MLLVQNNVRASVMLTPCIFKIHIGVILLLFPTILSIFSVIYIVVKLPSSNTFLVKIYTFNIAWIYFPLARSCWISEGMVSGVRKLKTERSCDVNNSPAVLFVV